MRPVYACYGKDIHLVGAKLGDAQVLKLLNNLVLAANMMNAVELLRVGEIYGLDANRVAQVLKTCSGGSFAMSIFENAPVATVMAGAKRYMDKDVQEAVLAAKDVKLDLSAFDQTVRYFLPR